MRKQGDKLIVYVFFGLIASGKSTLTKAWAKCLHINYYNSDIIRKELAGRDADSSRDVPFGRGIYSVSYTRKTYEALVGKAAAELDRGCSLVLDASYRSAVDRRAIRLLAKKYGAKVRFILCSCPETELKKRMEKRAFEPDAVSDGRWEIYQEQRKLFDEPEELLPEELITLSTMAPVSELIERLAQELGMNNG